MSTAVKRGVWALLVLACLAVAWFALRGQLAVGEPPVTPASVAASTSPTSSGSSPSATSPEAGPDADPAGTPSGGAAPSEGSGQEPAAPPTESAADPEAEERMTGAPAPWEDITAAPSHVDVYQDGEQIVGAEIHLTQTDEDGEIDPEPSTVGWYGPPQWGTTPGERSEHAGILAGHVVYYGVKDVFWHVGEMRAGALVVVTYDDGTQAAFRADGDAVSVEKEALTQDPANRWAWEPTEPGAKVTLITCDLVPGTGMAGNSFNNWVVQATRVR